MLFMGEEYAAATPFLYFCDFQGDLARAVTEGRRNEFRRFARFADPAERAAIPDPNDEATFRRSKLDWSERDAPAHREWLDFYRRLLALRHDALVPLLPRAHSGRWECTPGRLLHVRWPVGARRSWHLRANLGDAPVQRTPLPRAEGVYDSAPAQAAVAPPWWVEAALQAS
jgi:1,4-alpha-glucan branching enzyme